MELEALLADIKDRLIEVANELVDLMTSFDEKDNETKAQLLVDR